MRIHVTDARAWQPVRLDEAKDLFLGRDRSLRQIQKRAEDGLALPQNAERQFADDEGMRPAKSSRPST